MSNWTFFWCSLAAPDFSVCGISFYANQVKFWDTGKTVETIDPIYGKLSPHYNVYALEYGGHSYHVAYREHTPGVYLAYADELTLSRCTPRFRHDPKIPRDPWIRID